MGDKVRFSVDGGIATLTLHDPPANTYSYEMMQELDAAILQARMDDDVHVLVIRGDGDKFFCAGADIKMLAGAKPSFKYNFCLHANETLNRLEQTPKLVIAAINGHCVGGGLEVAMACDLRIARRGKGKIGLPEVSLGVLPGTGGTQRLARLVGRSKAIELMALGANLTVEQAHALGIVTALVDDAGFDAAVTEYARQFVPPGRASKAVGAIKRAVVSGLEVDFHSGLAIERELQQQLFISDDAKEGINAYVDKRPPSFKGR
ncbi:MAG: Enoyl-CoA hydratase [Myxococcales bacterium]|nr:Enoyl-CoA hydratase [Myxococcales bacterium]